jgi:2-methylcitrate dehydratase PrpD
MLLIQEPKTGLEGKFSIEYGAAAAIHDRKVGLAQYTDENVKVLEPLMKKVTAKPSREQLILLVARK